MVLGLGVGLWLVGFRVEGERNILLCEKKRRMFCNTVHLQVKINVRVRFRVRVRVRVRFRVRVKVRV